MNDFSEDEANLVAHRVVLAHFVSEAHIRLGDDVADFLKMIEQAAIVYVDATQRDGDQKTMMETKRQIIDAIRDIFAG